MPWPLASIADVASITTSLVTLALVIVTLYSVRAARDSAHAASESAKLAERHLQEAHRPLLLPGRPRPDGHEIDLPVENIGVGPALRVFCRAQVRNQPPGVVGRFPEHVIPGVAAGGEVSLRLAFRADDLLSIRITYVDVADISYTTESQWHQRLQRFAHTTVSEGDSVRIPVRVVVESASNTSRAEPDAPSE